MDALILAAGYGTRLGALTKNAPKPLLDVGGRPMMDWIIDRLVATGELKRLVVVTNHVFIEHFQTWARSFSANGVELHVLDDGTTSNADRRGANGDILFAIEELGLDDDLLVVGGDNLFTFDLAPFVKMAGAKRAGNVLFDVGSLDLAKLYGVADLSDDDQYVGFVEKPSDPPTTLISTCIYYFGREHLSLYQRFLDSEPEDRDRTGAFLQWAHKEIPVYGWRATGRWWDIGDKGELDRVREIYVDGAPID